MNAKIMVSVCFFSSMICADWKMSIVDYQQSDLTVEYAWRYSRAEKPVRLKTLTNYIQTSAHKKMVIADYTINKRGISLVARDVQGKQYDIFFDGQATHSIASNRSKVKSIAPFPKGCTLQDGVFCARALMQQAGADHAVINTAVFGYNEEQQEFKVIIRGFDGAYTITLDPVGLAR